MYMIRSRERWHYRQTEINRAQDMGRRELVCPGHTDIAEVTPRVENGLNIPAFEKTVLCL